ncbi:glycine betaine ABC transporter substrate-binding protein [Sporosarcina sp. FA9]|uniref:glycine betaine ABC transporter substrate-binding protein n=1 Tax=Sporosarcina sp. FA9 TaxID=3413030 RepID=UPI003F65BD47
MKKFNKVVLLMTLSLTVFLTACSSGGKDSITIGSKDYTENMILASIMGQLIENQTDIKVERKDNIGGSNLIWSAVLSDEIQIIPDYTGTIVSNYYNETTGTADETYDKAKELVQKDDLVALAPFGLNNTFTLAVAEKVAEEQNLLTFSDLDKISDQFTLAAVFEFIDRPDGLPGLQEAYDGMKFKEVKGMNHGMMYRAFKAGEVDVINAFTTDGLLHAYDLRVLEDDLAFFPPYYAMPIVRKDTLEKYPELEDILNQLADTIDDSAMQVMNSKVDNDGLNIDTVAKEFLEELGLIEK